MSVVLFQMPFDQILRNLQNMGFFLYLFPFLLALAIVYGVMQTTMGDRLPKSARGLISIIIAFFVMLYSSWNQAIVGFFAMMGGSVLIIASVVIFAAIIFGLMGFKLDKLFEGKNSKWVMILGVGLIILLVAFGSGAGSLIPLPSWSTSGEFLTAVFFIVIIALVMWWMGGEGEGGGAGGNKKE
jgi:hypothetical protein